eukprot:NODE_11398_length_1289_cov_6.817556.p2 GENE.NODE_11398_length_1289_cov_6.817556~~NODE_11398_length_1289_cov_6.817556.p2  ORF type:complete len:142 (+),score=26.60 NODE_11398_length_1289_cov_6.817556:287-712(+)
MSAQQQQQPQFPERSAALTTASDTKTSARQPHVHSHDNGCYLHHTASARQLLLPPQHMSSCRLCITVPVEHEGGRGHHLHGSSRNLRDVAPNISAWQRPPSFKAAAAATAAPAHPSAAMSATTESPKTTKAMQRLTQIMRA